MTKTQNAEKTQESKLEAPRFENGKAMTIAGLRGHFTTATWNGIPTQWQRLGSYGNVPGKVGATHYGLCFEMANGVDYVCGVEVSGMRLKERFLESPQRRGDTMQISVSRWS